jgi:hypothetical protein
MLGKFLSYRVNNKHRNAKPQKNASVWKIPEWTEIQLFAKASAKQWCKDGIIWAVMPNLSKIGEDLENDLYIAKYRCDSNLEWHGYPVHPQDADIPPDTILELWRNDNLIDKTLKSRIQRGKFSK